MLSKAIEVQSIAVSAGGKKILSQVSLQVDSGELVAIVGPSGCGKTTLLRAIAGLIPYSAGNLIVQGSAPGDAISEGKVVYGFQEAALFPWLNGRSNAEWLTKMRGERVSDSSLRDIWTFLDLSDSDFLKKPGNMSGGERQRVSLARSLLARASLFLLDEPLSAVDYLRRVKIIGALRERFKANANSSLLVTHDIPDAVHFADRIVLFSAANHNDLQAEVTVGGEGKRSDEFRSSDEFLNAVQSVISGLSEPKV